MSASRRKGNALELETARWLHSIDGRDERLAVLESAGGRLGPVYALQVDLASRRFAAECKNREDNPARIWVWLGQLRESAERLKVRLDDEWPKIPILVLKRNRRPTLIVLQRDDFELLMRCAIDYGAKLTDAGLRPTDERGSE